MVVAFSASRHNMLTAFDSATRASSSFTSTPCLLPIRLHKYPKMRQRITFLQQPQDSVDPKSLKVTKNGISTTDLKAAREDRLTFGFEELPQELYRVLKATHELHIRWASENSYESIVPFVSRISPGLHVFYTPQRNNNNS
jgi:hypothetical protein